jgi:hypothetical protein
MVTTSTSTAVAVSVMSVLLEAPVLVGVPIAMAGEVRVRVVEGRVSVMSGSVVLPLGGGDRDIELDIEFRVVEPLPLMLVRKEVAGLVVGRVAELVPVAAVLVTVAEPEPVTVPLPVPVPVTVALSVAVVVDWDGGAVVVGMVGGGLTTQLPKLMVFVSSVTAPLRAMRDPTIFALVVAVMEVRASILPLNVEKVPRVAEDPTCQMTLHAWAPPIRVTVEAEDVTSVVPIWKTNRALGFPPASRVRAPERKAEEPNL